MIQSLQEALQEQKVRVPVDWDPRPDQSPLWDYLVNGGLRAVECAHRRWGKDDVGLHWTCCAMLDRPGNYWHMLPEYSQARKVVWTAVNSRTGKKRIDESFPPWLRKNTKEQEMSIEFLNGSLWQLVGSDNYNSLVGSPPVGIVFSEWALANPLAWAYLSPILEENGGWALFIYTSRGNNHGLTMLRHAQATKGWFAELLPADKTPVFTAKQLETIHQDYERIFGPEMGDALFQQEYFCSFEGAQLGAYYSKQMNQARKDGRITAVPHITSIEVDTAWDLGVDDSMTIWFMQPVGREYHFIDYYENTGYGLEHYAKILKEKRYVYGNHYMPHDADVREMSSVGEIARTRKQVAEQLGITPIIVVERARNINTIMQIHIPAVRNLLPQAWFDQVKCEHGLLALETYAAEYDEEKKVLGNRPAHNWACLMSETHLLTKYGRCQIMKLPNEGEVMTLCGWKPYQNPRITKKDAQLVEVTFNDGFTVKCTPDHLFLTGKGWKFAEDLKMGTLIQSSLTRLRNILMVVFIEYGRAKGIHQEEGKSYTGRLGGWLLDLYQRVVISIIKIQIPFTACCLTLNVPQQTITYPNYGKEHIRTSLSISAIPQDKKLPNGIDQKQEGYGIEEWQGDQNRGKNGKENSSLAPFVIKSLWHLFVNRVLPKFIARHIVNPLAVQSVKRLEDKADVWCLTVPDVEQFSLLNGAIVHNSHGADAMRTFAIGHKFKSESKDWRKKVPKGSWRSV